MSIYNTKINKKEVEFTKQVDIRYHAIFSFAVSLMDTFNLFWNTPELSPQEHCDMLGNDAYKLFQEHQAGVQFVFARLPDILEQLPAFAKVTTVPEGYSVTVNEDGTVTITKVELEE